MKTAIIFLHGNLSDTSYLQKYCPDDALVICADGGAEHAIKMKMVPDVVVGDFDSITETDKTALIQKNVKFITYPKEKDYTDAELAVQYAVEHGAERFILTGLLGDRIDHMMANVFFLTTLAQGKDLRIIERDQEIQFISSEIEIRGKKDDEVSLIPMQTDCCGITTEGLYYPLTDATLPFGSTRGISNVMLSDKAKVSVRDGLLMVIHRRRQH